VWGKRAYFFFLTLGVFPRRRACLVSASVDECELADASVTLVLVRVTSGTTKSSGEPIVNRHSMVLGVILEYLEQMMTACATVSLSSAGRLRPHSRVVPAEVQAVVAANALCHEELADSGVCRHYTFGYRGGGAHLMSGTADRACEAVEQLTQSPRAH
jgi:hypothetical protein